MYRRPDRTRRGIPRSGAPVIHEPGHGRAGPDPWVTVRRRPADSQPAHHAALVRGSAVVAPIADRAVTVRIAALGIDLPVIQSTTVPCGVALEYVDPHLGVPGEGRATYLYAHAQDGMFLPLLTQSQVSNGSKMKGMVVEVWTNDDQRFLYVITKVLRHVAATSAFDAPFADKTDQVWLQTSEGKGAQPKLQVVADLLSQEAADHDDANPTPHPQAPTVVNGREVC
jgi:hypothetical protein